jgi:hypothetical protein
MLSFCALRGLGVQRRLTTSSTEPTFTALDAHFAQRASGLK